MFPDIVIMNSCLWDVNRRGPLGPELYEQNLKSLLADMRNYFPKTDFYWMTSPPSNELKQKNSVINFEFSCTSNEFERNVSARLRIPESEHEIFCGRGK